MEITTELVNHLADLSRLEFSTDETENFKAEFSRTLEQIELINNADLKSDENIAHSLDAENELKKDIAQQSLTKEQAVKDAPETMGSSISVPMMVD